jgi:tRNA(Arg) A34 adenosine deaminase TadA
MDRSHVSSEAEGAVAGDGASSASSAAEAPAPPKQQDELFEALFTKSVFPHFCRVFEECGIDNTDPDAKVSSGITDDGFKKMAECYRVKQKRNQEALVSARATKSKQGRELTYKYREDLFTLAKQHPALEGNANASLFADTFWRSSFGQYLTSPDSADSQQYEFKNKTFLEVTLSTVIYPLLNPDQFFSFCFWLLNHSSIPHTKGCKGEEIVSRFCQNPQDRENFRNMVALIRFCHLLRFWHWDGFVSKSQCIFELCYCSSNTSMFNLCFDKEASQALRECMKLIDLDYLQVDARKVSPLTSRWILLFAGRSVKQWGHRSSYEFEQCEVEKEPNYGEKWRHLIFSYAVMALLYSEFNGNKQGPLGRYYFRDRCKIGQVVSVEATVEEKSSGQSAPAGTFVYSSKMVQKGQGECSDYLGHNIVALAVCKRGSILRVSYNHNVLFSSTVDHAEERLIDGLFKDPSAFIAKSHARMFSDGQRVNIEEHMKHISVYTSLEPCQQCSGKLHIAEVPELVFCQRDWVSYSADRTSTR